MLAARSLRYEPRAQASPAMMIRPVFFTDSITGTPVDPNLLKAENQTVRKKSIKERLLGYLTAACILIGLGLSSIILGIVFCLANNHTYGSLASAMSLLPYLGGILSAIGIALLVVYFIRKKALAKEIEVEEKALEASKEQ